MSLTLDLSSVSHEWIETQGFLAGISQKGCAFLHKSYQGVQDVLMLGALTSVKVVSPWFLHYKFTVFSFVINKYLETLQRLCRQSFLLRLYLFILAPINGFVYRDDYSGILLVVSIFLIPSSFINWNFVRKISLSSSVELLIYISVDLQIFIILFGLKIQCYHYFVAQILPLATGLSFRLVPVLFQHAPCV